MFHPSRRRLAIAFLAALTLTTSFYGQNLAQAKSEGAVVLADTPDDLTLWYDKPATDWETQALPIGNGALGAMVFGGVESEQIQFNEKSLWTGGPGAGRLQLRKLDQPRGPARIAEVQAQIDRDEKSPPEAVAAKLGQPRAASAPTRPSGTSGWTCPGPREHGHRLPPRAGPARRGRARSATPRTA